MNDMIVKGRLPISSKKVTPVFYGDESSFELAAADRSANADLVILGLTRQEILKDTKSALISHPNLKDVLFVNSRQRISIF